MIGLTEACTEYANKEAAKANNKTKKFWQAKYKQAEQVIADMVAKHGEPKWP